VVKDAKDTKNGALIRRIHELEGLVEKHKGLEKAKSTEVLKELTTSLKAVTNIVEALDMKKWLTKFVKKKASKNKSTDTKIAEVSADLQKALMILSVISLVRIQTGELLFMMMQ